MHVLQEFSARRDLVWTHSVLILSGTIGRISLVHILDGGKLLLQAEDREKHGCNQSQEVEWVLCSEGGDGW